MRYALAAVVIVVLGAAIAGVGMGDPPPYDQPRGAQIPAPTAKQVAASKRRIANGWALVKEGRDTFDDAGCDACHSIAATGASGQLGPRLDTLYDPRSVVVEDISKPRAEIVPGYQANLMPTDYVSRLGPRRIKALAAFIKAASGRAR